jgi:hypothetical protein
MMYKQNFVAVVKCDGKILREQDSDVVYLPFGSEYSILLKNKDNRRSLVSIEVDGQNVLNNHKLIVNGNETQEIKGFMKDMINTNRFRFIHKTKEIQRHRGDKIDDGLIRITYQFEKYKSEPVVVTYTGQATYTPRFSKGLSSHDVYTHSFGSAFSSIRDCCSTSLNSVTTMDCSAPLSEEGITVKGSKINQNYSYGNIDSLESNIYTIVLHLKGLIGNKVKIQAPITTRIKLKCSSCGRKNKSINKFCYNCGTFLE